MITRIVKMTFKESETQNFEDLFENKRDRIAGFKGCLGVELLKETTATKGSGVYFTRSIWIDELSLEKYRQSELFAETWKDTKSKFADQPQAWSTKIVSAKFE